MCLASQEIRQLCEEGLVTPFTEAMISSTSLDLRLGSSILVEINDNFLRSWKKVELSETTPYFLKPGQFVLADTLEMLNMPPGVSADFKLKSSLARNGLGHSLAGWAEASFDGTLTLELSNHSEFYVFPLLSGMRIGQLIFFRHEIPDKPYDKIGRYCGQIGPTPAREPREEITLPLPGKPHAAFIDSTAGPRVVKPHSDLNGADARPITRMILEMWKKVFKRESAAHEERSRPLPTDPNGYIYYGKGIVSATKPPPPPPTSRAVSDEQLQEAIMKIAKYLDEIGAELKFKGFFDTMDQRSMSFDRFRSLVWVLIDQNLLEMTSDRRIKLRT